MVRHDGADAKKERMERIARKIMAQMQKTRELDLSKAVAEIEYEEGLTKEKAMAYLETLDKLGRFILDREHDKIKKVE